MEERIEEIAKELVSIGRSLNKHVRINEITSETQNLNRKNVNSFIENSVEAYNELVNELNDIFAVERPDDVGAVNYYEISRRTNSNGEEVVTATNK